MSETRLGVNIDHVATLRQQRGEDYPCLTKAADQSLAAGAVQITMHLREDRRHVQDQDMVAMAKHLKGKALFNFELGVADEIVDLAISLRPEWMCLVPEKREERTTEGGLDLLNPTNFDRIQKAMKKIREQSPATKISLFVEAQEKILEKCIELKADAVEIHTGDYAIAFNAGKSIDHYIESFQKGKEFVAGKLSYHAGHGLTDLNLKPLVEHDLFVEYNIGHWIICEAVFEGLENVVKRLMTILRK